MSKENIPLRKDVPAKDKWDLSLIYKSDEEWEADLKYLPELTNALCELKGKLSESAQNLLAVLKADEALSRTMENVFHYANLMHEADQSDSTSQDKVNRAMMAYTQTTAQISFYMPELLSRAHSCTSVGIRADCKQHVFAPVRCRLEFRNRNRRRQRLAPYTQHMVNIHGKPGQKSPQRSLRKILQYF